jgi:predicted NAD-dependent protein-ADP-ribosyltransferase YbiA (DUF1768 family)
MKFKYGSSKPDLAGIFSKDGTVHAGFAAQRAAKLTEAKEHKLLLDELVKVASEEDKYLRDPRAEFDQARWLLKEDQILRAAIQQRLDRDVWFCAIAGAAAEQKKKLVYENPADTYLGAKMTVAGKISGGNKYANTIEELVAAMPQAKIRKCLAA